MNGSDSGTGGSVVAGTRRRLGSIRDSRRLDQFLENNLNVVGLLFVSLVVLSAVFAPAIAPEGPNEQDLFDRLESPSAEHPMGTDQLGRDVLSRLLYGARISLRIAVVVVTITLAIGTAVGLVAGYAGGWVDEALMRVVDVLLAFPGILLALVIAGILGPSLTNIMIALAVVGWTQYARIIRGSVLSVKEEEFVKSAQLMGVSRARILLRHVLPNVVTPVVVLATMDMAYVILGTAGLSFLGLGAQPPTPEWGTMLSQGRNYVDTAWWIVNFPGLAIMITVLGFNLLGDGLRDVLDPRDVGGLEDKGM
ncbi:nickel transporter permease [Halorarum salinum]|uniref:ABC transporter permease n=1 Tax=Halorarum salinum TaxID=2743089 RepID=A0A7D5LCW4_9EURY|nr:nickel transporter permease [Halobaculum salinum]QLG63926.1 ABC transporter permease [Halobaculum salinum]